MMANSEPIAVRLQNICVICAPRRQAEIVICDSLASGGRFFDVRLARLIFSARWKDLCSGVPYATNVGRLSSNVQAERLKGGEASSERAFQSPDNGKSQ
jgi:hypothetical protein